MILDFAFESNAHKYYAVEIKTDKLSNRAGNYPLKMSMFQVKVHETRKKTLLVLNGQYIMLKYHEGKTNFANDVLKLFFQRFPL